VRHYSMPEGEAIAALRPKNRKDQKRLLTFGIYLLIAVAGVTVIFVMKHRHREEIEQSWQVSTALIEDVRFKEISRAETARGGAMLYDVEVLANYTSAGTGQKRWIRVEQRPEVLSEAQLQAFRWKGKQCFVRWNISRPDQIIADVN
jgi:hypothetical protein